MIMYRFDGWDDGSRVRFVRPRVAVFSTTVHLCIRVCWISSINIPAAIAAQIVFHSCKK